MSIASTTQLSSSSVIGKNSIFHDPPIISSLVRLNIIELDNSDKQIVNELVYRCCRILTRNKSSDDMCRVIIIDTIASMNPIRLATTLKRDSARLRQIQIARQCKINSTYATLCANLRPDDKPTVLIPKLFVIYHDEFFIMKTLNLLKEVMTKSPKTQFILVLPRLDRLSRDALNLMPANQIIRCDFDVNRRDIAPAPPDSQSDSYQRYLNRVVFKRQSKINGRQESLEGELTEDGLKLLGNAELAKAKHPIKSSLDARDVVDGGPIKKYKISQDTPSSVASYKDH